MIREATIKDVLTIQEIVNHYASNSIMLPLSLNDVYEKLYDFSLYIDNNDNEKIIGVIALHPIWADIAEVRSFAVRVGYEKQGIGSKLLMYKLNDAKRYEFKSIFALTYQVEFFTKNGFRITDIELLPKKIWTDCLKCVKYPNCDETAVIIDI